MLSSRQLCWRTQHLCRPAPAFIAYPCPPSTSSSSLKRHVHKTGSYLAQEPDSSTTTPEAEQENNVDKSTSRKEDKGRLLINDKIPFSTVSCVNPETGKLDPPTSLKGLIQSLNEKSKERNTEGKKFKDKFVIQLVSWDPPVVKIISQGDAFEKRKLKAKQQRLATKHNGTKEIQLTWGVAEGDLKHKINKARTELTKGCRIDVVFAPKARVKPPRQEEMSAVAAKIVDSLRDVGWEWKEPKYSNAMMVLYMRSHHDLPKGRHTGKVDADSLAPL